MPFAVCSMLAASIETITNFEGIHVPHPVRSIPARIRKHIPSLALALHWSLPGCRLSPVQLGTAAPLAVPALGRTLMDSRYAVPSERLLGHSPGHDPKVYMCKLY
jgi:hypothetical protein